MNMKRLITILILLACSIALGYNDMLDMLNTLNLYRETKTSQNAIDTNRSYQSAKFTTENINAVRDYQSVESLADLKLWVLEQTQPRIFIRIETADNATDIGYFRIDYRNAGKLGKIGLLREYFNIK
jgi:hypothetical protein